MSGARPQSLWPLFLISAGSVGYEIALTRYFAVAKWSEYGYWVISIVMAGLALSGVTVALARTALLRRAAVLQPVLPVLLIAAAALGYHFTTANPFNPLQLQNPTTWLPQLANIGGYYACLLPFFFLTGLYISLSFVVNDRRVGLVYGFDLTGAGVGALLVLVLMLVVHPFRLVPVLLLPLAAAALLVPIRPWGRRLAIAAATLGCLLAGEALLLLDDQAAYNDFKAIYAPLHVPDSRTLAQIRSPRGLYTLLDDFTERVDTDVSNDAAMLGLPGPPQTFGLYRDGNRIAALPKPGATSVPYAGATLAAFPYLLHPGAKVLLLGPSGGFRLREALALGAAQVDALEPDAVLRSALRNGLGPSPAIADDPRVRVSAESPAAAVRAARYDLARYDLIDISGDFLDEAEANAAAFTVEAIAADLRALDPGGIVSIPVSIREFPAYAVRMLATVRPALLRAGMTDPGQYVVVYRSAWNVRILVSNVPWDAARIALLKKFCSDRSFDVSYYPGIDVAAARAGIYNDLPAVSFEQGEITSSGGPADAIADEARQALAGEPTESQEAFNLAPITYDRPFFYDVLRLERLGTILKRLEMLPQAEIGPLVNLAVLGQAVLIALVVLLLPLVRAGGLGRIGRGLVLRSMVYFAGLGLGFLFIEITLIDRASFYLNDRASGFALVLTGMLICSGAGSLLSSRCAADPRRALLLAVTGVVLWCGLLAAAAQPAMLATIGLPWLVRAGIVLLVLAPVSVALGLPFPLGLERTGSTALLPWAWGLNGAFSVVATPLANLIALQAGFNRVLLCAAILYVVCSIAFPSRRESVAWQDISAT
ncbi:MAG: hypothetical protein JO264_18630 [Acidisphaera sp.]|nr:hypothetical protein [Acidisphaera sp.]